MCRELILFSSTAFAQLPAEVCGLQSLLVIEAGLPTRFWLACGPFARDCYLENDSPSFTATHRLTGPRVLLANSEEPGRRQSADGNSTRSRLLWYD